MLTVLLAGARPVQRTASPGEVVDLLTSALRAWFAVALGPNRASSQRGAAVLSLLLPLLLLFPAASIAWSVQQNHAAHQTHLYLARAWDWPAWVLWGGVGMLVLVRWIRPVRWVASAALVAYLSLWVHEILLHHPQDFIHGSGWIIVQVGAAVLLVTPRRLLQGIRLIPWWLPWATSFGMVVLAFGRTYWSGYRLGSTLVLAAVVAAALGVWALRSATGRAVVPSLGACVAFMAATRVWANHVPADQPTDTVWQVLRLGDLALLVAAPALALLLLRGLGRVIAASAEPTAWVDASGDT